MKYMGSKEKMLPILGNILSTHSQNAQRIADPFCGSAAVSWFLAETTNKEIIAGDIQSFAVAMAQAVIERTEVVDPTLMLSLWFARAAAIVDHVASHFPNHMKSLEPSLEDSARITFQVTQSRKFCKSVLPVAFQELDRAWPISKAYGGYYYSPTQALVFDALRQTLPIDSMEQKIAIASLVESTSRAAASPGHTAQPFQPTSTSAKYIIEAWSRNPWELVRKSTVEIAKRVAKTAGLGVVGDFTNTISLLKDGDLVFADPPYSDVHYSRFYHALETITRGMEFEPMGKGRYPALGDRPSSAFSKKSEAYQAANILIKICAEKNLILVLTFPKEKASNGLKATDFIEIGTPLFSTIQVEEVLTDFSTLGGNTRHRAARKSCGESIISFLP